MSDNNENMPAYANNRSPGAGERAAAEWLERRAAKLDADIRLTLRERFSSFRLDRIAREVSP